MRITEKVDDANIMTKLKERKGITICATLHSVISASINQQLIIVLLARYYIENFFADDINPL